MSYVDVNTPVISRITLPSGNTYYLKDAEIREVVQALSETIAGGVSFVVAWDGTAAPVVANIPKGVKIVYNNTTYTGTLEANNATPGAFYLVKSSSQTSEGPLDIYDEYVPVGSAGSKYWEKLGDTQVDLSKVVTNVTLEKQTDTVIGSDATFTITQPTVSLATGATAGDGVISVATDASGTTSYISATATGANTAWNSKDQVSAITSLGDPSTKDVIGANATFTITQPTISLATNAATATGRVQVVTGGTSTSVNTDWLKGVSVSDEVLTIGAADYTTTYLGATATGANTAWNSKDSASAVTGYASVTTDTVIGTDATFTITQPTIALATSTATATGRVGVITSISASTTNIKATASGANTAWNNKDQVTVLTSATSLSVTKGA